MQLLPTGLERLECPTAWYGIDSHTNYRGHVRLARLFDVSLICHRQFVKPIARDSGRPTYWLPVACPVELLPDPHQPRTVDVGFVGAMDAMHYPERGRRLEAIRRAVDKVEFGPTSPAEMMERYARSKIVFNSSFRNDLNMRYFEAMGAGAVLVRDAGCLLARAEPGRPGVLHIWGASGPWSSTLLGRPLPLSVIFVEQSMRGGHTLETSHAQGSCVHGALLAGGMLASGFEHNVHVPATAAADGRHVRGYEGVAGDQRVRLLLEAHHLDV